MKLEHSFTVPTGIDEAWQILLDIERIGPCMPGAAIDSVDGDDFTGTVKVKLGPIGLTYKGKASFTEKDAAAHRAVIDARGRDSRGNGTAAAKVTAVLENQGGSTLVTVDTDLDITGKPAQFGRGVMVDVGNKLIGQFADNLAATISGSPDEQPPEPAARTRSTRPKPSPAAADEPTSAAADEPTSAAADEPTSAAADEATAESSGAADEAPVLQATADTAPAALATPAAIATAGPIEQAAVDAVAAAASYSAPAVPGDERPRSRTITPPRDVEPINLIESAGPAVAKRLAPLAAVLVLAVLVLRRRRAAR